MKLSIGCGKDWKNLGPGWQGLDKTNFGQLYVHDMEITPWPISKEYFDEVRAEYVLEHIHQDKVIAVMNEIFRVLEPGGILELWVPYAIYPNEAFSDPTHLSYWTVDTFKKYFCGKSPVNADYGMHKWQSELYDESVEGQLHVILKK